MKWFRIMLATFLIVGMLLCPIVAYANEEAEPEDNPEEGVIEDSGLQVDIVVIGDNPDVGIDVIGDNPQVELDVIGDDSEVTVNTTGTEVWINGQNLNKPTAIYNISGGAAPVGVDGNWVKRRISQALAPLYSWADEYGVKVELAANGLAKVIFLAQGNESTLEAQVSLSDEYGNRLTELESSSAYLGEQVEALEAQDEAITAYIQAYGNHLRVDFNRKLVTIGICFGVIVLALAIGLGLLWRKTRII